ncbi:MAG: EVE domain-containing protein [Bacteriovoracia bacterium]
MSNYWLMKSEPDVFSFEDLKKRPKKTEPWNGVRNYQARNFMRDEMKIGDLILFYHSSCDIPGVAGIAKVSSKPYPDSTQFDPDSEYFDPKATLETPRWFLVDVSFESDLKQFVSLEEIKKHKKLEGMRLLQRGNRLSILPVAREEFEYIKKLGS